MGSLTKSQWIGVLLLVAAVFIIAPIPLIDEKTIGAIIVGAIGIYQLIK